MCEELDFGTVVRVKADSRHDTKAFPFAMLLNSGTPVSGGGMRYNALFINCLVHPASYGSAKLYTGEFTVLRNCSTVTPERAINLIRAAEQYWTDIKQYDRRV